MLPQFLLYGPLILFFVNTFLILDFSLYLHIFVWGYLILSGILSITFQGFVLGLRLVFSSWNGFILVLYFVSELSECILLICFIPRHSVGGVLSQDAPSVGGMVFKFSVGGVGCSEWMEGGAATMSLCFPSCLISSFLVTWSPGAAFFSPHLPPQKQSFLSSPLSSPPTNATPSTACHRQGCAEFYLQSCLAYSFGGVCVKVPVCGRPLLSWDYFLLLFGSAMNLYHTGQFRDSRRPQGFLRALHLPSC